MRRCGSRAVGAFALPAMSHYEQSLQFLFRQRFLGDFELVIFDCDGVLVDSERLSASVLTGMMAELGFVVTPEVFREDFLGRSFVAAAQRAEQRSGRKLPDGFQLQYRQRLLERMRQELKPMPGVEQVLGGMTARFCLATSSSPERLAVSLGVTGLARYFEGKCFTASEVTNGKPAPDLFFHAAASLGVAASRCLVIEDSEMGVLAAQAAGMAVWHFAGGSHMLDGYRMPESITPEATMQDMQMLARSLAALGLCTV